MTHHGGEIMDERTFELTSAGMVAEIEMRAAIAANDRDAMVSWVRRGSEIRSHLRALHQCVAELDPDSTEAEVGRAVLTGLAGTFSTLVTRHSSGLITQTT